LALGFIDGVGGGGMVASNNGAWVRSDSNTLGSELEDNHQHQETTYFEYEALYGGALGDRNVIIWSTINSNILKVIKFITEDDLQYGSKFSQVCLHSLLRDVTKKKYWNTSKKYFGRALNTKRSTCYVAIKASFMSKLQVSLLHKANKALSNTIFGLRVSQR
jgi:hypothetical protein